MRLQIAGDVTYSEDFSDKIDPEIIETLKDGYSVVNMEGPITDYGPSARKSVVISQPPEGAEALVHSGVRAASLANNHVMDHLARGLMDTIEVLDSMGIAHFGAGRDIVEASTPLRVGDFSLIGFATTLPPGSEAAPGTPGVSPVRVRCRYELDPDEAREQPGVQPRAECSADPSDVGRILRLIRREKDAGRRVVVVAHWGIANQRSPLRYQRELARRIVGAGADLIVGAHPHGLVGHEIVGGSHVFYGVGALILRPSFSYPLPRTMQSVIVRVDLDGEHLSVEPIPLIVEDGYPRAPSADEASTALRTLGWTPG
ncbi:CapA family protein [Conexivisphaera calida]|uniref:Enzyme of poly-gamma-glutamate biosynthesis n=1 Tax=Conexivisphaera calida TaxID=1874277 RepID=A0A4P2VIA6_9ARCH|nr:CapA family protein [Conexivisphaera calida]BBE42902.1 Putative enzyme of poly-gamma-glutamate biosynthesis [Conexivisphaera calida]